MTDNRGQVAPAPPPPPDFSGFYSGAAGAGALPVMRGPEDMPDPDPSTWLDTLTASFRSSRRDIPGYNIDSATDEYKPLVDAVTAANGKPWTLYVNPQTGQTDRAGVWKEIEALRASDPRAFQDIPATREEYDKQVAAKTKAAVNLDQQTISRGPTSAWLAGGLGAGLTDPFNVGTMWIGGPGKTIAQRIISEAFVNAALEGAEQPLVAAERAGRGETLTLAEAATNVAVAGVGGAAFQGVVAEPVSALLKRFLHAIPVENMTDAERAAVGILQRDAEVTATSPFEPGAGTEAHGERLNNSMQAILDNLPGSPTKASPRSVLNSGTSLGSGVVARGTEAPRVDVTGGAARTEFKRRVHGAEASATNDYNEASGAMGPYQFLASTWNHYYIRRYGRGSLTDAQIAAKRRDPALNEQLMDDLTADNAAALRRLGARETAGNLYLEHFAGQGGAEAILRAAPDTPIERLLSPKAIEANPFLQGKTAKDVIDWAHARMGERVSDAPTVRRDQFAEGETGDAEWQAAQRESDAAELDLERTRSNFQQGYLADAGERQAARAERSAAEDAAMPMGAPDNAFHGPEDFNSGYLADAGERQAVRAEMSQPAIDPNVEPVRGEYGSDQPAPEPIARSEPDRRPTYAIEDPRVAVRAAPEAPLRTVYVSGRGAERMAAAKERGASVELDERGGNVLVQSDRGLEAIPFSAEQAKGMKPVGLRAIPQVVRAAPGKAWSAVVDHGAVVAKEAAPAATEVASAGTEGGITQAVGATFSDPGGSAARTMADGITHDLKQALDSGELGDIAFAADGVEIGRGESAPHYKTARGVLAELDADDAAIAALEACL